ncbi:tumor protein p63-regulated gene 1-like protein [Mobula hypostoma]|uniref:tumor protein p63-regulated gene 1-like protein n=1 Tax=Mobula hypostoma TaxID=723540 RepID=UPI002FC39278
MGDEPKPCAPFRKGEEAANVPPDSVASVPPVPAVEEEAAADPGSPGATTPAPATDFSHLYPPLPRGEFSPTVVPPSVSHGARDEFFALRPGTLQTAISETEKKLTDEDGKVESAWLLVEVDHWNREIERLVLLTPQVLLVCHYDFVGLYCHLMLRIPLHYIDSITVGPFQFPAKSFSRRSGLGLRIQWDKLREPSFRSRWNPWSRDLPFLILTEHPGAERKHELSSFCEMQRFRTELTSLALTAHQNRPLPGRANGPLLLEKPIQMETFLGLVSALSNWSQLGYSKPRGLFGF